MSAVLRSRSDECGQEAYVYVWSRRPSFFLPFWGLWETAVFILLFLWSVTDWQVSVPKEPGLFFLPLFFYIPTAIGSAHAPFQTTDLTIVKVLDLTHTAPGYFFLALRSLQFPFFHPKRVSLWNALCPLKLSQLLIKAYWFIGAFYRTVSNRILLLSVTLLLPLILYQARMPGCWADLCRCSPGIVLLGCLLFLLSHCLSKPKTPLGDIDNTVSSQSSWHKSAVFIRMYSVICLFCQFELLSLESCVIHL